jgi:hypothetical protein
MKDRDMMSLFKATLALALCVGAANTASAAVITYHQDNAGLRGALSQIVFEDFEDTTLLDGLSISGSGNIATGLLYRQILPARPSVFTFDDAIFGFGGMIRASNFNTLAITVLFEDGSEQVLDPFAVNPATKVYLGFSSDVGIRSVSVKPAGAAGSALYLDDLTYGHGVAAVPEPATWGMMIIGLAVIGSTMRRQRTSRVSFA